MTPKRIETVPKMAIRALDAHKGTFGTVLIVAGSRGMAGAAALAGRSALRSGAGLVRIACPESIMPIVAGFEPTYTTCPLPEDDQGRLSKQAIAPLLDTIESCDVVALGPGLGQSHDLQVLIETLICQDIKLVLDADGLNNLSKMSQWPQKTVAQMIVTPHPGEMKRLWRSVFRHDLPEDRSAQATEFAQLTQSTTILKGHQTVVTDAQSMYLNTTGNPGMATGGAGDVLTGVIAALVGQGLKLMDAAVLGTYIHGLAGDMAAQQVGQIALTATDIIESLPKAWLSHGNLTL